jgi:hypothetical protein
MKKLFTERVRLVVYLEQSELTEIQGSAKRYGQTIQEWARGVLRSSVQRVELPTKRVGVAVRRDSARARQAHVEQPVSDAMPISQKCPHHKERGSLCYKCDPKFGVPQLA